VAKSFAIQIFMPEGDPQGVRIFDRMNWTGQGVAFRRIEWDQVRRRRELEGAGVYILVGDDGDEEESLPKLYIGQSDGVKGRIENHILNKDFWDRGVIFVSTNDGLNKAHIAWLEYALIERAMRVGQSRLDNGNVPKEPALSEADKAETEEFFVQLLQILPLADVRAFEFPTAAATPRRNGEGTPASGDGRDTVIVPARKEGFEKVFLGEHRWHAIRIAGGMLEKIKFIAAYQTQPVSAITHWAAVERIEAYGDRGKYQLIFSEPASKIGPIPLGDAAAGSIQGPRYTSRASLLAAKKIGDLAVG